MRYVLPINLLLRGLEANDLCYAAIHGVTVGSFPADFVHQDPFAHLSVSNPQDVHNHPELKRRVYSALAEGDEGELSISIPREVAVTPSGNRAQTGIVSEGKHSRKHGTRSDTHRRRQLQPQSHKHRAIWLNNLIPSPNTSRLRLPSRTV